MEWLYEHNTNNRARYVLGTVGEKPLVCFGVNPSTAVPGDLDPTLKSVERFAKAGGFDSFIMLNLYPQRSTDPNGLHKRLNRTYHTDNLKNIEQVLKASSEPTIWAAWGTLIEKRPYLERCLKDILELEGIKKCRWITIGKRSKKGHPHHPLYLRNGSLMDDFDVTAYKL